MCSAYSVPQEGKESKVGKSMSSAFPNGYRHVEKATRRKLAPRSLRRKHRYLDDCTDAELNQAGVLRTHKSEEALDAAL